MHLGLGVEQGRIGQSTMQPSISIIIPTHNRWGTLPRCIESARFQTLQPTEIIVVDDGSTDGTFANLEALAEKQIYEECPVVALATNHLGAPRARNVGIQAARGDWLLFLDSDDVLLPNALKSLYGTAVEHSAEVAHGRVQYVTNEGDRIDRWWGRVLDGTDDDLYRSSWQTMAAIYSKKAIETIGPWNEELKMWQDLEYCIRAVASGLAIAHCPEVVGLYTTPGADSIGKTPTRSAVERKAAATIAIARHLVRKNKMSSSLEWRYARRLAYFYFEHLSHGDFNLADALLARMSVYRLASPLVINLLRGFRSQAIASLVLHCFHSGAWARNRNKNS